MVEDGGLGNRAITTMESIWSGSQLCMIAPILNRDCYQVIVVRPQLRLTALSLLHYWPWRGEWMAWLSPLGVCGCKHIGPAARRLTQIFGYFLSGLYEVAIGPDVFHFYPIVVNDTVLSFSTFICTLVQFDHGCWFGTTRGDKETERIPPKSLMILSGFFTREREISEQFSLPSFILLTGLQSQGPVVCFSLINWLTFCSGSYVSRCPRWLFLAGCCPILPFHCLNEDRVSYFQGGEVFWKRGGALWEHSVLWFFSFFHGSDHVIYYVSFIYYSFWFAEKCYYLLYQKIWPILRHHCVDRQLFESIMSMDP